MTNVNELYFNSYALPMFEKLCETALLFNRKNRYKRFYIINSRNGEMQTFGIYDVEQHKHIMSDTYNPNCERHLKEMKNLVYSKSKFDEQRR